MKKYYILFFAFISSLAFSQDVITKKNGEIIQARVQNISNTEISYERAENKAGPTFSVPKNDVYKIKYENGTEDIYGMFASLDEAKNYITTRMNEFGADRESSFKKLTAQFDDNILVLNTIKSNGKDGNDLEKWDLSKIVKVHNLGVRDNNIGFVNVVCYQIKEKDPGTKKLVIKFKDQKAAQEVIDALKEFMIMVKR
jgi:hypothetical protein